VIAHEAQEVRQTAIAAARRAQFREDVFRSAERELAELKRSAVAAHA
jgi:hypothetical protein